MAKETVKDILEKEIRAALQSVFSSTTEDVKFSIERPERFGDFATNAAMAAAKQVGKSPKETAEILARELEKSEEIKKITEKIEVAGPGFTNFYLKPEIFVSHIGEILKKEEDGEKYGKNEMLAGKKAIVEYTDPNPFKEFHIGHLVPNTIGESISRLVEWSGAETKRANYQGDVGMHVAKAIYDILKEKESGGSQDVMVMDITSTATAYVRGAEAYESGGDAKEKIIEINKKIYEKSDDAINKIYEEGRKISLDYFEAIYKKLGTKFDYYFFESEAGPVGKKIVEENIEKVFEKGENGAVIFPGEKVGLHTRVFLNSEGLPTYEAKELGVAKMKYEKFPYDISLVVAASEITEYFKVLLAAMKEVFPELSLADKTQHIANGILKLPTGKMSSRTGDVITAERLIDEVEKKVLEKIAERDLSESEKKEIAEKVAIGAIKFSILRQATGKDIIFDFDKSISFEGDSGPYLQYTLTRALSVLRKGKVRPFSEKRSNLSLDFAASKFENTDLERLLFERFPEILERAGREYEPHYVCTYLIELAGAFNSYYAKNQIVGVPESQSRLALTQAAAYVLTNGLTVLGIPTLEKM